MVSEGAAAQPRIREDERDSAAIASLMDPAALERRLAQARAQRVAALAARKAAKGNVAAPSTAEQRQLVPLPPRAPHQTSNTRSSSGSVTPDTAVPPITSALQPIGLPPLVAERRPSPPTPRRVLPAGVLIGFAAGAVAALGAVVVIEPRFDLRTWTGAAPSDAPSAATRRRGGGPAHDLRRGRARAFAGGSFRRPWSKHARPDARRGAPGDRCDAPDCARERK